MARPGRPRRSPFSDAQSGHAAHLREPAATISGAWLLRWLVISLLGAAMCGYLTMCLLFYQGQWQIIFHPSRSVTATPATLGMRFDDIRFDYTETGVAQLDGWWIPAAADAPRSTQTLLYLHGASGSLSDVVTQLEVLHSLGVNVFAIDYRGFGLSMNTHPSEQNVYQDANAAFNYLTSVRHLIVSNITVYGVGIGAIVAAETARSQPHSAGLILETPAQPALTLIERDPRTKLLPVRLLFRDRFELAPILAGVKTPTLFLGATDESDKALHSNGAATTTARFSQEAPPYKAAISSFLDSLR